MKLLQEIVLFLLVMVVVFFIHYLMALAGEPNSVWAMGVLGIM